MNPAIVERLTAKFSESIRGSAEFRGDLTVTVKKEDIARVGAFLKSEAEFAFDMIIDVLGVDMYRPQDRFEVVYILYSLAHKSYLRLKVLVDEQDLTVPTVTGVWPGANWTERETYDMFGIVFTGHPDLRRFYMPEEFEYYPLRKDFPTMGIPDSLPLPRR
ncbi:MAG TPA: NADH-quinone oxidoreductase subunit C [Bacteroidota bacterium]|nr:NADH-quinone oxidoreductase subunit C [Bacteroidota bacterium]